MCFKITSLTHSVYQKVYEIYVKDLFESIPGYRKKVILLFSIKNDVDRLTENGCLKKRY